MSLSSADEINPTLPKRRAHKRRIRKMARIWGAAVSRQSVKSAGSAHPERWRAHAPKRSTTPACRPPHDSQTTGSNTSCWGRAPVPSSAQQDFGSRCILVLARQLRRGSRRQGATTHFSRRSNRGNIATDNRKCFPLLICCGCHRRGERKNRIPFRLEGKLCAPGINVTVSLEQRLPPPFPGAERADHHAKDGQIATSRDNARGHDTAVQR